MKLIFLGPVTHITSYMHIFFFICVGSVIPFVKPSGLLIFGEESVQRINLTLIYDTLEVCTMYLLYVYTCLCDWICEKGSYTRIQFFNFKEMYVTQLVVELQLQTLVRRLSYH